MRVLAIDPSLRCTGYAVLEEAGSVVRGGVGIRAVEFGEIRNSARLTVSACLVAIHDEIARLVQTHEPECGAVEAVIYVQSFRTAITLGSARGVAMFAMAARGMPVYEYAPRRVKQAVVGRGGAAKTQVSFMVRALLGLKENPPPDAADAMAVGLAHFQAQQAASRGAGPLLPV